KADPQNPKIRLALAYVRLGEGKIPEAIKELEELPPPVRCARVVCALAARYLRSGQHDKAATALRPLVKAFPDLAVARYYLGHAALRLNRTDEAIEQFRAYVQLAPNNALGAFSLGTALLS